VLECQEGAEVMKAMELYQTLKNWKNISGYRAVTVRAVIDGLYYKQVRMVWHCPKCDTLIAKPTKLTSRIINPATVRGYRFDDGYKLGLGNRSFDWVTYNIFVCSVCDTKLRRIRCAVKDGKVSKSNYHSLRVKVRDRLERLTKLSKLRKERHSQPKYWIL